MTRIPSAGLTSQRQPISAGKGLHQAYPGRPRHHIPSPKPTEPARRPQDIPPPGGLIRHHPGRWQLTMPATAFSTHATHRGILWGAARPEPSDR